MRYYLRTFPHKTIVLRASRAEGHQAFIEGKWIPTMSISDHMTGQTNDVEGPVAESRAREVAPEAFPTT